MMGLVKGDPFRRWSVSPVDSVSVPESFEIVSDALRDYRGSQIIVVLPKLAGVRRGGRGDGELYRSQANFGVLHAEPSFVDKKISIPFESYASGTNPFFDNLSVEDGPLNFHSCHPDRIKVYNSSTRDMLNFPIRRIGIFTGGTLDDYFHGHCEDKYRVLNVLGMPVPEGLVEENSEHIGAERASILEGLNDSAIDRINQPSGRVSPLLKTLCQGAIEWGLTSSDSVIDLGNGWRRPVKDYVNEILGLKP